jgi:hypothetical protein
VVVPTLELRAVSYLSPPSLSAQGAFGTRRFHGTETRRSERGQRKHPCLPPKWRGAVTSQNELHRTELKMHPTAYPVRRVLFENMARVRWNEAAGHVTTACSLLPGLTASCSMRRSRLSLM